MALNQRKSRELKIIWSVDIDQLGSLIPGVNFDSLDFETLDVNNPEQLQAFADVIQESNVDLASIAQNFDPRYYIR